MIQKQGFLWSEILAFKLEHEAEIKMDIVQLKTKFVRGRLCKVLKCPRFKTKDTYNSPSLLKEFPKTVISTTDKVLNKLIKLWYRHCPLIYF